MEGYISEVRMFAGNFAPRSWMFCNGTLLSIAQYTATFALLGTTYGGDGQTTFGLPDLRGRVAVHTGQGAGLSNYVLGQMAGTETNTLLAANVGGHTHVVTGNAGVQAATGDGQAAAAVNNFPAGNGDAIYGTATDNTAMAPASLAGVTVAVQTPNGNQPVNNLMPYTAMNFIICVEGIFPSRN
ncbi:MAG: phage tail protein [Ferruginibacter sp.]|nr:phage tail protein [Ferruginibacter sp.]